MEPLSIISAVASISKTVYSASTTLHTFVKETRNVDQTIKDLATEVDSLGRALIEVEAILRSPLIEAVEKRGPADDNKQLWQIVHGYLEDCQITVARIDSVLDKVRKKHSNWATQAFRQVKLNLAKEEVNSLKVQTHTHCSALKMTLQMVNIRAAYMAPELVITDLGPRIETLQGSLDLLTTSLEEQRREIAHMSYKLPNIDSTNTARLRLLATDILSKATTVYGSTVAGGSVLGDPTTNETRLRTLNWIPEPITGERVSSRSSAPLSRVDRSIFSEPDGTVDTDLTERIMSHDNPELADSDSDGEFEFDVTQRLLDNGKESFNSDHYAEAIGFLQEAIAKSNRLPNSQRTKLDLAEVPMMIATCKFHLKDLDQAEGDLLMLVRQESTNDQHAIRACHVSYLLSQIYLIKNQLEVSEDYCRKSLKGRRRLLGQEHYDYLTSLGLLSEICSWRGKNEEARIYQDMIPPEIARLRKRVRPEENHPEELDTSPEETSSLKAVLGHTDPVLSVAFSPDGKLVATGSKDTTARVWDAVTGARQATLKGHTGWIRVIVFSPDSKLVATASADKTARVWDVTKGTTRLTLVGHKSTVTTVAFSPDSKLVVTGSSDNTSRLWDTVTGATRVTLRGHTSEIMDIAFSPDGKLVATGSRDSTARVWNSTTGFMQVTLKGHRSGVWAILFSSNSMIVTGSGDKTARLWDAANGAMRATFKGHTEGIWDVAVSPDGRLVATGSSDGTARLWDTTTGAMRAKLDPGSRYARVHAVAFSPDGRLLVTASTSTARLWDVETGAMHVALEGHASEVSTVAFSPDGKLVATGSSDNTARIWDTAMR